MPQMGLLIFLTCPTIVCKWVKQNSWFPRTGLSTEVKCTVTLPKLSKCEQVWDFTQRKFGQVWDLHTLNQWKKQPKYLSKKTDFYTDFYVQLSRNPQGACNRNLLDPAHVWFGCWKIIEWSYLVRCDKFIALYNVIASNAHLAYRTQIARTLSAINCIYRTQSALHFHRRN